MTHRTLIHALLALAASSALAAAPAPGEVKTAAPERRSEAGARQSAGSSAQAAAVRLHLVDGRDVPMTGEQSVDVPLALVEREPITVGDLREASALAHSDRKSARGGKMNFSALLDRLIDLRLVQLEARSIGIAELDDVKAEIQENRERVRLDLVQRRASAGVKVDPAEVQRRYEEAAREWNVRSVLFLKKDDATAFGAALEGGGDFAKLASQAVAEKKARSAEGSRWMRASSLLPDVSKAVAALPPGRATAPIRVGDGWTVVRVESVRRSADKNLRAQVEEAVRAEKVKQKLEAYYAGLKKQYVTLDQKVLESVDFDSPKPGFEVLRKDSRAVARIAGDPKPVTVGEVAEALARPLYHGIQSAQSEKRLDKQKAEALDSLVSRRLVAMESARQGIDALPETRRRMREFERDVLFTKYVERVIIPEVKLTKEMLRAEYAKRKKELTYPAFYRLDGIAFADARKAQAALARIRSGTDYDWLRQNADGIVPADPKAPVFDGSTVSARQMPPDLRKALTGARERDVRPFDAAGQHFLVRVRSFTPERVQPFEDAVQDLTPKLRDEMLERKFREWVAKLRKAHDVKVYLASAR